MSEFFDFNPTNGMFYSTDYSAHEDKLYIHAKQDVSVLLDDNQRIRNSGQNDKASDFMLYARIPPGVEMEIKKKYGLSIYDKGATKKLLQIINRDYPKLRCGNVKHE